MEDIAASSKGARRKNNNVNVRFDEEVQPGVDDNNPQQKDDSNLLPRKRPQTKSPVDFGIVVEAEGKILADELNTSAAWESPSHPKLRLLPSEEMLEEVEPEVNVSSRNDDDEMDEDELSNMQSLLDESYDNATADSNINLKKKVHTPKRQKRRDVNVNPRQLQQKHLPQSDTAPSLQSSYSSTSSFSSILFSPTPHRPQTRRMTHHQQQQQQRRQRQNNDNNDGNGILFSPRPVDAMMSTRNRLLPPGSNNANNAVNVEMLDPSSPLTPSPKFIAKEGDTTCKDGIGPNLSTDTLSSSSSTLPLDKSHSFSPTIKNNETSTETTTDYSTTMNMKPFRFHSFPASLPRVRPRVDGDTTTPTSTLRPKLLSSPATRLFNKKLSNNANVSGDCNSETGSVTSGTNERIRKSKPSFPARDVNQLNLLQLEEDNCNNDSGEDVNDDGDESFTVAMQDNDDEYDLILPPQPTTTITNSDSKLLSGTRLNFSSPLPTEGDRGDELNDAEELRKEFKNDDDDDDTSRTGQRSRAMTSPTTYLPTNYMALDSSHDTLETTLHPHTPRGLLFNAAISMENLEVSPITRWPEDNDEHEIMIDDIINVDNHSKKKPSHAVAAAADMLDTSSGSLSRMIFRSIDEDAPNNPHHTPVDTAKPVATCSTHRPTAQRKFRPMPDTSAFDISGGGSGIVGRSMNTPSQRSLGSKDSGFHSHKSRGGVGGGGSTTSVGLLCPPTPIRTPAWAHHAIVDSIARGNDRPFIRANSLISTKVLATTACPPRVLDNLSSLEDSMLENDITGSTIDTSMAEGCGIQETSTLNQNALLTLDEKDEHDDCNFRSLEDRSTEDESSPPPTLLVKNGETSNNKAGNLDDGNRNALVEEINFSDFDNLGILGSGAFADVYKVRARKGDRRLYAIKRTRRQFRGVKDRERAMAEVHTMKRLQSELLSEATAAVAASSSRRKDDGSSSNASDMTVLHQQSKSNYGLYLLFFIRAWQQDGFFYVQTELCSRANCRHLRLSISSEWARDILRYPSLQLCKIETTLDHLTDSSQQQQYDRLIPERGVWQICHDISRGLLHIHTHGMVHGDIKPSNIFFVYNSKWGTICKIGDFGMAGDIGTKDDGQEGDTVYMPNELLSSCEKHRSADVFSLGITLYELAASPMWSIPPEGERWHEIRSEAHRPDLPSSRNDNLVKLIRAMTLPNQMERPSAENILKIAEVKRANASIDSFLSRYVNDVERYNSIREREMELAEEDARRR